MKYKTQIQKKHYLVSKRWGHNNQKTVSGVWKAKNTKDVDTASCPHAHRTAVQGRQASSKVDQGKSFYAYLSAVAWQPDTEFLTLPAQQHACSG